MGDWTSAMEMFRETDRRMDQEQQAHREARLAVGRRELAAAKLEELVWGERVGEHVIGLFVRLTRRRWPYSRFLWCVACRCGWHARQGYPIRTMAESHWRTHAEAAEAAA